VYSNRKGEWGTYSATRLTYWNNCRRHENLMNLVSTRTNTSEVDGTKGGTTKHSPIQQQSSRAVTKRVGVTPQRHGSDPSRTKYKTCPDTNRTQVTCMPDRKRIPINIGSGEIRMQAGHRW
jgi:hypothetical protein